MSDPISKPKTLDDVLAEAPEKTNEPPHGFEIDFRITNNRIEYSFGPTMLAKHLLAEEIVAAVRDNWPLEHIVHPNVDRLANGRLVSMNRYVEILWTDKKIRTNMRRNEGDLFKQVLAYFVDLLRAQGTKESPPTPAN